METYIRWGQFILLRGDMISHYVDVYGEWGETEIDLFRRLRQRRSWIEHWNAWYPPTWKICSGGKLYCCEPQRHLFYILCGNIAMNNRLNVMPAT